MVYLNNAATTWPKPPEVIERLAWAARELMETPGRGGASMAERAVFETREALARFIGASDSSRVVFTCNATAALNMAISGFLREGSHVVTTSMDHNSVARPLARMEDTRGVRVTRVQADPSGCLTPGDVNAAVCPDTELVVLTHASNVTGSIQPVEEIVRGLGSRGGKRPKVLVDAAQSLGVLPVDVEASGIDMLAAPGHKALYGPAGTGFLYVAAGIELDPFIEGGTGSGSDLRRQPEHLPDRLESGTPNLPGIAALGTAVRFISEMGMERVRSHESALMALLRDGLEGIAGVTVHGPSGVSGQVAVLSFTVEGMDPAEVGGFLEEAAGVHVRVGLHCSPHSHRTIGTWPEGTVRVSPGLFNTPEDIDCLLSGVREMTGMRHR